MTEAAAPSTPAAGSSAGALLRAARERQGLHVAALAAAIKIPQRKLEALEADRLGELPDATFARALALTVCRALKIDPGPVLEQLPQAGAQRLADVAGGLNAPFRERPGRSDSGERRPLRHPLAWAALLVLLAAVAVLLLPAGWWQDWWPGTTASGTPAAAAPSPSVVVDVAVPADAAAPVAETAPQAAVAADAAASAATVEVVHSVPAIEPGASAGAASDAAAGVVVLRAADSSWVEVVDGGGQVLVQRTLQPGESLGLDGRPPFKLKIGNAAGTQLQFRGNPVDLAPLTRDNVARLELK
ncbi:MAG TPA: helix-turn-helix domain-containing protein [Rubrivivax sp.]|nr:helix-turn-helix domain-containing protein [Rubrivivax sp.]